ncbi:MAG TPA: SAM-dependent methyltransferase [Actinomycetota bacterium]
MGVRHAPLQELLHDAGRGADGAGSKGTLIPEILASSFRDPSGFVFTRDGQLYRQVNASYREDFDALIDSGLYRTLVERGLLVAHEDVTSPDGTPNGAYRILRPELVPFISYPYEWCFGQLKDAALATLEIQRVAMDHGMSLKDASAYNIQFRDARPVLIDTLSFERLREGEPWVAYRQFCQHFLAPLALMSYRDVRLGQLLRIQLDGIPLDLAAELLPAKARARPQLMMHLFAHAKSQTRHAGDAGSGKAVRRSKGFSRQAFTGLVSTLESGIAKLTWTPETAGWAGYYGEAESYSPAAAEHKREIVQEYVRRASPSSVWDLGGNVGVFARIASEAGIPTICLDADPACVQITYAATVASGEKHLLPLVVDLTNPSPSIGWENRERLSLAERGPADMALALALVHHLAIANNVPLDRLADAMRALCTWLAIEFVPKSDPKVQGLLALRDDIFPEYDRQGFERAFASRFAVERADEIRESGRVLYLMRAA